VTILLKRAIELQHRLQEKSDGFSQQDLDKIALETDMSEEHLAIAIMDR
jgi:hypothetical protein